MSLSDNDKKLLIFLLEYLDFTFTTASCNDIPPKWVEQYSAEELRNMLVTVAGDDITEYEDDADIRVMGDTGLIEYLKQKIQ